jgi:uncharacterized protein (TIGR00645 family)
MSAVGQREDLEERVRRNVGRAMFAARWIMAPIYLGLLAALVLVVVKFVQKLVLALPGFLELPSEDAIFLILTLIDLSLVANLIVIVMFAGWENFVGRLLTSTTGDRPSWMAGLDFGTVKLRLIGSIAAIAGISILETFVHIDQVKLASAAWQLAIMLGVGALGVLLALADWLSESSHQRK